MATLTRPRPTRTGRVANSRKAHGDHDDPRGTTRVTDTAAASAEPLGPVDRRAWAAATSVGRAGVVAILALYLSIQA